MQLLQPGPVYTCPKREGGRRTSQNAMQPASGRPSQRERRCDWELEHLGFKEGGGGEEEVGGRVRTGVSAQHSVQRGRGGDWGLVFRGFSREVGTRWLMKVPEVQVPDSGLRQSLAFTSLIWFEERMFSLRARDCWGGRGDALVWF